MHPHLHGTNKDKQRPSHTFEKSGHIVQVGFPDDWQVRGPEADKIRELLKEIPAARKTADPASAPWYTQLTDAQVADCDKDPQLFVVCTHLCLEFVCCNWRNMLGIHFLQIRSIQEAVWFVFLVIHPRLQELSKINSFESQFAVASQAQATKFGLPAITLDELPATMDPIVDSTISDKEVKWILSAAREQASNLRKNDPRFSDPFNTPAFHKAQDQIADRLGMTPEQLKKAQADMTSEKWRQAAAEVGVAV